MPFSTIDTFGGIEDAIADAASRAKLGARGRYQVHYVEKQATPFERFFNRVVQTRVGQAWLQDSGLAQSLLAQAAPHARDDLALLDSAARARRGARVQALAYCFCGL